jgi:hypothetical protein
MKESSDTNDKYNLTSVYGALFFGVPSGGMDTKALAAMVGDKPQRYDLSLLDQEVGYRRRSRQHEEFCRAFDFEDSKIIQFFEMKKTSTVIEVGRISVLSVIDKLIKTGPIYKEVDTCWSEGVARHSCVSNSRSPMGNFRRLHSVY